MFRINLALVDEQPLFLAGLANLFGSDDRFKIVATGSSPSDLAAITHEHQPDLLITELSFAGETRAAIQELQRLAQTAKILVCTSVTDIDVAVKALDAGARGYVLKGSSVPELLAAIEAVGRGDTFINQCFAAKVIAALRQAAMLKTAAEKDKLSLREQQIVQQLLRGRTNREIAHSLAISEKTVKHYMTIIMQKLHARNRLEVVIAAQQLPPYGGSPSAYAN
ncbi:LuxR C-terminal-related transcriptional regulator [Flaviflagellibacter deserti]|uniref:LuxR C-terminal-related transcriptional regulator n=1 Tax=Flaviflagellibacter deserti TaxID=2267266 RepID=A0ABV9Z1D9_9HYPH